MRALLGEFTTDELGRLVRDKRVAVLVPVGSVEPHGPHLPLDTDVVISETAAMRAAHTMQAANVVALVAPSVAYGVTNFAQGFTGALSIRAATLSALVRDIADSLLQAGVAHVSFVNNHLEPAHNQALLGAVSSFPPFAVSLASPLSKRWGRTLSAEYRSGACHAGRYETSLVLAAGRDVRDEYLSLPGLDVSLSQGMKQGQMSFRAMGLDRAYTGAPSEATKAEGDELYTKLATMIVTEVQEALERRTPE